MTDTTMTLEQAQAAVDAAQQAVDTALAAGESTADLRAALKSLSQKVIFSADVSSIKGVRTTMSLAVKDDGWRLSDAL